tara:strand:+ start:594 stop:1541 length:948 start_codon:yes stop_codon:yes gene_type:complete
MKKVLLIGGSGYLGARISKHLAENDFEVFVLCRSLPKKSSWESLISGFIIGDIAKKEVLDKLSAEEFDIAIHLVPLSNQGFNDNPDFVSSVNVLPTWNLLRVLTERGLKKFIYFSSIHIYGKLPKNLITENFIPNPISPYGLNHLLSENICNYYDKTTNTTCINIRLSNSYGSPVNKDIDCWWLVLNEFCKSAYQKEKITIRSDGSTLRDFIHWYDIINALELIIKNNNHNTYHIASGQTLSILELAYEVKDVFNKRYNKELRIYFSKEVVKSNIKKIKKHTFSMKRLNEIGYRMHKEVSSGINEIFDYMEGAWS